MKKRCLRPPVTRHRSVRPPDFSLIPLIDNSDLVIDRVGSAVRARVNPARLMKEMLSVSPPTNCGELRKSRNRNWCGWPCLDPWPPWIRYHSKRSKGRVGQRSEQIGMATRVSPAG